MAQTLLPNASVQVRARSPLSFWGACLGLAMLGLYLRVGSLTSSLWLDEFGTFWVVERDLATALLRAWQFQGQSPLYYLIAWIPIHVAGESEAALRVPSLVLGCLFCAIIYASARWLFGSRAGGFAVLLGWFSAPAIRSSVEARPYALVLFSVAVAVGAFHWAVRTGSRQARILWVLGGAAVAWSHYVQYPLVAGLFVAYAILPDLRTKYPVRRFVVDGVWQMALVSLCLPQILALWMRRQTLSWIDDSNYLAFWPLLVPLVLAIALGEPYGCPGPDRGDNALRRSLWVCLLTHVAVLEVAAIAGVNLLNGRYFLAILVPGLLLAARALSRIGTADIVVALVAFTVVTGADLGRSKLATGNFSWIWYDGWRGAVAELSARLRGGRDPLVLFRSGFVEEDLPPLGSPPAATLAPLRSPGCDAFAWPVKSLTLRWNTPQRETYFRDVLAQSVTLSSRFFVLSLKWGPESRYYHDEFEAWVQQGWPGRFRAMRMEYGEVELLEFRRKEP